MNIMAEAISWATIFIALGHVFATDANISNTMFSLQHRYPKQMEIGVSTDNLLVPENKKGA